MSAWLCHCIYVDVPASVWQLLGFTDCQEQIFFLTPASEKPLKISGLDETYLWTPQLSQDVHLLNCNFVAQKYGVSAQSGQDIYRNVIFIDFPLLTFLEV